jgi:cation transport ATPase
VSIFRKDKPEENTKKPNTPEVEADSEAVEEEFTDINEVARSAAEEENSEDKMEEIYSTSAKRIKYKNLTPIEFDAANKRKAATKKELINGKLEFSSEEDPSAPEVELKAEIDPGAVVADEIIEDVREVRSLRGVYVQDIDDIDISLDPMDSVREYERRANDTERQDARKAAPEEPENPYVRRGEKIVAHVPVYHHSSKIEKIYLKAGRFTEVVESEYDEYLKSTDPTISKNYHAMQRQIHPKQSLLLTLSQMAQKRQAEVEQQKKPVEQPVARENFDEEIEPPQKKQSKLGRFFRVLGALIVDSFVAPPSDDDGRSHDYNGREDEKYVLGKIREEIKKLGIRTAVFAASFAALLTMNILERTGVFGERNALLYCGLCLAVTIAYAIVGRRYIADGLRPLRRFKGNSNTPAALAVCACVIQGGVALFTPASFVGGEHHLYGYIAALAMMLNTLGRLMMTVRVKRNFSFITAHSPAYAAKIYNDEETARRMVSGTTASKGVAAYQHLTRFLSDFLKISYAPDPSEEISGKMVPVSVIVSVFVTAVYAILFKSVPGAASAMTVMLCISVPFTAMLAGNLPMMFFSKRMLKEGAMVAGYPSVKQFCDTTAVMLTAAELFPKGCVKLEDMTTFQQYRVEDSLLMAAAVLQEAASPIAPVFDDLIAETDRGLPAVESVMFEEKSGLVGWIGGERVLVGNITLMNRYHVAIPEDFAGQRSRSKKTEITYIACSGRAVAALSLSYSAPRGEIERLQKAEDSGLAFIVSSPDPNVSAEMIAEEYGLFFRSVKIMSPGYANEIEEVTSKVEETSRAYLATRGRQSSLARAVGGCIGLKSNITLGIAIGIFGLALGILLCATLALYASVARLSVVEMMIYIAFWTASSLIAENIRRP